MPANSRKEHPRRRAGRGIDRRGLRNEPKLSGFEQAVWVCGCADQGDSPPLSGVASAHVPWEVCAELRQRWRQEALVVVAR